MHSITNKTSERPVKFGTLFCLALKKQKVRPFGRTGAVISCKCLPLVKISIRFQLL